VREGGVELLASDVVNVDGEGSVLLVPAGEDLVDVVRLRGAATRVREWWRKSMSARARRFVRDAETARPLV
jgi:hypothetical protein